MTERSLCVDNRLDLEEVAVEYLLVSYAMRNIIDCLLFLYPSVLY